MRKLSRDEALKWCVENIKDWHSKMNLNNSPDQWYFGMPSVHNDIVLLSHNLVTELAITKQDWLEAKKNKENDVKEMKKELMMKAAFQFKGVWPKKHYFGELKDHEERLGLCLKDYDEQEDCQSGIIYAVGYLADTSHWQILCNREQFEAFVESLFEGAPDDATHYRDNLSVKWYKVSQDSGKLLADFWFGDRKWQHSNSFEWGDISINELIQRPAKKAEPEAPYMPKVGKECEYFHMMDHNPNLDGWAKCFVIGFIKDGKSLAFHSYETDEIYLSMGSVKFRPLHTEHDQLTDALVNRMINHYGNPKGAESYKTLAEAILSDESIVVSLNNQK